MNPKPLNILLVEDDELFRLGLVTRLQQEGDILIVAEAEDGETAVELVSQHSFDVVILDVGLPGIGGVEACRQIKQKQPLLPVLVLTSHSQKPLINRLIEAKAQGYCLKGIAPEALILAIRSVAAGASWWDSIATQEIQETFGRFAEVLEGSEAYSVGNPLTKREQEILALIASGKSNQEIADILYIAPGTVRVHVHTILKKLNARDRTQAALVAIQKKLVAANFLE
ncbi:response regulator transcription factor [Limnoraphis robusta]|uniref:Response regulator transcription factor n=1 Tax=Limnoraphis robusta CCNP1315 TaxID=3110306 RepID=A0ABU5TTW4_9CYAN|nr:response regulator transcription factor [Limnoraphis robusta]MEA5518341.1 response regulator transcription factor [Limnoraphis robusta CCNP1315]MEA5547722.1 response regulator transcription factor [Limnoraphis robusta CCNP1324]